jgi:hypothetical protein
MYSSATPPMSLGSPFAKRVVDDEDEYEKDGFVVSDSDEDDHLDLK